MKRETETLSEQIPHMRAFVTSVWAGQVVQGVRLPEVYPACHWDLEGGGRGRGLSSERPLGRTGYIFWGVAVQNENAGPLLKKIIKNFKMASAEH